MSADRMSQVNPPQARRTFIINLVLCLLVAMPPVLAMAAPFWSHAKPWSQPLEAGPSLAFSQYAVDLGRVRPADELRATFRFRNSGDKPVTITEIKPSCGCLMPRIDKQTYAPGENGQITLRMQPANEQPGQKEFFCDILYTDTRPRTDRLTFRLHLPEQRLSVRPSALIIYQLSHQPTTQPLFVTDSRGHEIDILGIRTGSPFVSASMTAPAGYQPVSPELDPRSPKYNGPVSALQPANLTHRNNDALVDNQPLKPIPENEPLPAVSQSHASDLLVADNTHATNEKVIYITVAAELPPGRHHAVVEIETADPEVRFLKVPVMIQGRTTEEHTHQDVPPAPGK